MNLLWIQRRICLEPMKIVLIPSNKSVYIPFNRKRSRNITESAGVMNTSIGITQTTVLIFVQPLTHYVAQDKLHHLPGPPCSHLYYGQNKTSMGTLWSVQDMLADAGHSRASQIGQLSTVAMSRWAVLSFPLQNGSTNTSQWLSMTFDPGLDSIRERGVHMKFPYFRLLRIWKPSLPE